MSNLCEFYPCHDNPCKGFSCEFCYCPLYETKCEEVGGTPEYILTIKEIVKDCSKCMLPHQPNFNVDKNKVK